MGGRRREAFRVGFDRLVKLEFRGAHVTSDAGLLAFRELDDALGLTQLAGKALVDARTGKNTRHGLIAQLRQAEYSWLAGYEGTNDADQLCDDPAMRYVVGERARSSAAASTSQMGRFDTEILTQGCNLQTLMQQPGRWIDQVKQRWPVNAVILDLDSSVSESCGHQAGARNGGRPVSNKDQTQPCAGTTHRTPTDPS